MASRRCLGALAHRLRPRLPSSAALESPQALIPPALSLPSLGENPRLSPVIAPRRFRYIESSLPFVDSRLFSSRPTNSSDDDEEEEEEGEEEGEDGEAPVSKCVVQRGKSEEEKVKEAAEIGYKVIGRLDLSEENPFKLYEPVFAVVQIGSHQFKVSNGDSIFTERLKYCEVNDKLILSKVLMLGSRTQTVIGRPILPDASVHAVVEEHALDAKVIIFKKKRRKNYRRTKGHRQELTKLRITDIQGVDKSENVAIAA